MKGFRALSIAGLIAVMCLALFAQQPPATGGQGARGGAAAARGGAARGGRGERGGRAPAPAPTGPVANATNGVYSKSGTDLKAVVIQLSINGHAIVTYTGQP